MTKTNLPTDITTYDLLKSFAVVIMIIDHIGAYFFPDLLWWRAVGRIGFPIWFFLVGYARGRDLPLKLLICIGLLLLGDIITGRTIFPLSALVTIALIRIMIDPLMAHLGRGPEKLWPASVALFLIVLPSSVFCEYGTQALITAIFGYLVRHREEVKDEKLIFNYMLFAFATFLILQYLSFGFSIPQFVVMGLGTYFIRSYLYNFNPRAHPELTQKMPGFVRWFLQLGGRRTLEIYVVHLLLFKAICLFWGFQGYDLFAWDWVEM